MRFVVFLKNGENKPIEANRVVEGDDYVKFIQYSCQREKSFWKSNIESYEPVAYFLKAEIIGYEKIFGE